MGCWSVELVVFFSTLDYQILPSPNHSSPFISVSFIYVWDLRLQNEMF